jgi:hypothetical protein
MFCNWFIANAPSANSFSNCFEAMDHHNNPHSCRDDLVAANILANDFVLNVYKRPSIATYTCHCGKDASRDLGEVILLHLREKKMTFSETIQLRASFWTLVHRLHGVWRDRDFLIDNIDVDDGGEAETSSQTLVAVISTEEGKSQLGISQSKFLEVVEDPFSEADKDASVSEIWDQMIEDD